jgi:hypothetical protein
MAGGARRSQQRWTTVVIGADFTCEGALQSVIERGREVRPSGLAQWAAQRWPPIRHGQAAYEACAGQPRTGRSCRNPRHNMGIQVLPSAFVREFGDDHVRSGALPQFQDTMYGTHRGEHDDAGSAPTRQFAWDILRVTAPRATSHRGRTCGVHRRPNAPTIRCGNKTSD